MQARPIILKFGGSIITDKRSGKPVVRTRLIKRLAREIAHVRSNKVAKQHPPLILLYGAGSFGHPLAHKYRLLGRTLSIETLVGMAKTTSTVCKLGIALTDIFLEEGVSVVPLQTSSFVQEQKGKLVITNYPLIEDILSHGGIPMFGGDVIIADRRRTAIVSADTLASELVQHFRSQKLLFATDVNGVYKRFPAQNHEKPLSVISRKELQVMTTSHVVKKIALDVTGAMAGKLRALLPLRNCTVTIFNGLFPNTLTKVLRDEMLGTRIVL